MKYLLSLHIHSCFASVASGDRWVHKQVDASSFCHKGTRQWFDCRKAACDDARRDFDDMHIGVIRDNDDLFAIKEVSQIPGWTIYWAEDNEFYWAGLHKRGMAAMKHVNLDSKVDHYKSLGFGDTPADFKEVEDKHKASEEEVERKVRALQGYVFTSGCSMDVSKEHHRGGLSTKVFDQKALQDYLNENTSEEDHQICVHGYIGNSNRRFALDEFVESYLRDINHWTDHQIAVWLTSSDGRHFADSYEKPTDCYKHGFTDYSLDRT